MRQTWPKTAPHERGITKAIYLKNDRYMSKKDKRLGDGGIMAAP
jgi:hypothetical protein